MSEPRVRDNIILIGFMGSGKSTVGRMLARKLRFQFLDTDHLIEERARMTIKQMFDTHGEQWFRDRETAALESLLTSTHRHVLATGGGIVTKEHNAALLKQLGWVVLLRADPDEIFRRVSRNRDRPLLRVDDPYGRMTELLVARQPLYDSVADFSIDSTGMWRDQVAERILEEARKVFRWRGHERGALSEKGTAAMYERGDKCQSSSVIRSKHHSETPTDTKGTGAEPAA